MIDQAKFLRTLLIWAATSECASPMEFSVILVLLPIFSTRFNISVVCKRYEVVRYKGVDFFSPQEPYI